MTKHTPGPWRVIQADRLRIHGPRDEIGWPATIVYNAGLCSDPENQANARLIAAAPDMLAALQMHSDLPAWPDREALIKAMDATRAAIAKATGA